MSKEFVVLGLLLVLPLGLHIGCSSGGGEQSTAATDESQSPGAAGSVTNSIAVIDLDRVADGIDAVSKMRNAIAQYETQLLKDVRSATAPLFETTKPVGDTFAEFDRSAARLVEDLPPDRQKEFAAKIRAAQAQIEVCRRQIRQDFLNEVRPYAFQIARSNGCQLVLTTDQVFVAAEQVDITSQVIQKIRMLNEAAEATSAASATSAERVPKLASGGTFPIQ